MMMHFLRQVTVFYLLALVPFLAYGARRRTGNDDERARGIMIVNNSNAKVGIFWINPSNLERIDSVDGGIPAGSDSAVNSYIGHRFEVIEEKGKRSGICKGPDGTCRKTLMVVTKNHEQMFTLDQDFQIDYEDAKTKALAKAKLLAQECPAPTLEGEGMNQNIDEWTECLQQKINATLDESREEIDFQASVRKNMGQKLVNYACFDEKFEVTPSLQNSTLRLGIREDPTMRTLFDADTSKIVLIENFVARSHCNWIKEKSGLRGDEEASATLPWTALDDAAVATVVSRMYTALDQSTGFKRGQELMEENRYHSVYPMLDLSVEVEDADSAEMKRHLTESDPRHLMASIVLFCEVPSKGGAVHFPKAGVHIKPKAGDAVVVTYMDPVTRAFTEDEFTSELVHCPVLEGKRIMAQHHFSDEYGK